MHRLATGLSRIEHTMSATTLDLPNITVETKTFDPTASDRCDSCSARAYVSVGMSHVTNNEQVVTDLLFCAHHYTEHEPSLASNANTRSIQDRRDILTGEESTRVRE